MQVAAWRPSALACQPCARRRCFGSPITRSPPFPSRSPSTLLFRRRSFCSSFPPPSNRTPSSLEPSATSSSPFPTREYFYYVNLVGRLYCIGERPTAGKLPRQNDPTFLREARFLDFFYRRLRDNTEESVGKGRHLPLFAFVSPCGQELNYVRAADKPVVFHSLARGRATNEAGAGGGGEAPPKRSGEEGEVEHELVYASSLRVPFRPERVVVGPNERLYHPAPVGGVGLLSTSLAMELSANIHMMSETGSASSSGGEKANEEEPPSAQCTLHWNGKSYRLQSLHHHS